MLISSLLGPEQRYQYLHRTMVWNGNTVEQIQKHFLPFSPVEGIYPDPRGPQVVP